MEHWECAICGLRSRRKESSFCPESKASFFKVHDWQDAFTMAQGDGLLVWEYESSDDFAKAQRSIRESGWVVEQATEVTRPVGAARMAVLGPAAWLARPKGVLATLRFVGRRPSSKRRGYRRQSRPISQNPEPTLNGFTIKEGRYSTKDSTSQPPSETDEGQPQKDLYHRTEGNFIYKHEKP